MDLHEHLFRHEAGRMTASLTRLFGLRNLTLAEDVVQDAFCRALEVWKLRGVPPNPSAWLMATARNRALDLLRRDRTRQTFAPELTRLLETEWTVAAVVDEAFSTRIVLDEQLRMMLSCCQDDLAEPVQTALILNILCGFGAAEIAAAYLTGRAAVEKRISRGKKVLAESRTLFSFTDGDVATRLCAVHRALYLLFSEGYHGGSAAGAVRAELCDEAMRLMALLREHPVTATPATHALSALMSFNAARLPARVDPAGELHSFLDQDRTHWDAALIAEGRDLLDQSAEGDVLTTYHIEAAIAALHVSSPSMDATDWDAIITWYDRLMMIAPSPVVALNRAIAVAQRDGPGAGIEAIESIDGQQRLDHYPFLAAALGELERRLGNAEKAQQHFETAVSLARNGAERAFLERRLMADG